MRHRLLASCALVTIFVTLALAGGSPASALQSAPSGDLGVFDLQFKGGSVTEYASAIRNASPRSNIIVMPGAGELPVPAMDLKSVDLRSAVGLLDQHDAILDGQRWVLRVRDTSGHRQASTPIYTLFAIATGAPGADPRATQSRSSVISLSNILEPGHISAADALTAIETALTLVTGQASKPEIRFHEETGLLIARGTEEQIHIIYEVVAQLEDSTMTLENARQRRSGSLGPGEREGLLARIKTCEDTMTAVRNESIALQTPNDVLRDELDAARRELSERNDELRVLSTQVHMLQQELSQRSKP